MPRNRQRTTTKGADQQQYSRDVLEKAVEDVKNGNRTTREAARFYEIPRSTLRHYVNGTRGRGTVSQNGVGGGGAIALPREYENQLAQCLRTLEKWGFGLSRDEVMDMVQKFVKLNDLKSRFKDGRPGPDWFVNFRQRHNLSIKKPQGVEYVRMSQVNPYVVNGFFDLLEKTIQENGLTNKPHLIFNCDETSFSHDPSKTKVVGGKGQKCTRTISSAGRENTSVLMAASAAGDKHPILCVFKGKNIMESWIDTTSDQRTGYAASKSGWMDSEIFLNWFQKVLIPNAPPERPILLILDGHGSHVSLPLILKAVEHQVILLKLPPHTTHVLQPLDVGVFKSLKSTWDKQLTKWQRENPRKRIPKQEFVSILSTVYTDMLPQNIKSGFKATGIFDEELGGPNRKSAINNCDFKPCDVEAYRRYQLKKATAERGANKTPDNQMAADKTSSDQMDADKTPGNQLDVDKTSGDHMDAEKASGDQMDIDKTPGYQVDVDKTQVDQIDADNSPGDQIGANKTLDDHLDADRSLADPILSIKTPNAQVSTNPGNKNIKLSFEDIIVDIFHKNKAMGESATPKRKRVSTGAEIMTANEYIEKIKEEKRAEELALQEKNRKQQEQLLKKKDGKNLKRKKTEVGNKKEEENSKEKKLCKEKTKKKNNKFTPRPALMKSEASTSGISKKFKTSLNEDSDDSLSSDSDISLADYESDNILPSITVIKDDYVIVSYDGCRYPGQVIELKDDQVQVKHMKSAGLTYWRWPEQDDILCYDENDILKIIKPPIPMNKRGIFSVPELKGCLFEYE